MIFNVNYYKTFSDWRFFVLTAERKQHIKDYLLNTLTVFTGILPVSLCAAIFMGFHYSFGINIAVASSLICSENAPKKIMPAFSLFLVLMYASLSFGTATLSLACFICGILSIIYFFIPKKLELIDNPVTAGLMLSTALSVTVMLTTHYFGIGATGYTVKEMIASYLSLGFHPNWRGVLYGTVVMVIMITFPRKFKKFCNYIKAPFIAVAVTVILNLFLNPSDFKTAINEIGSNYLYDKEYIPFFSEISKINIPSAVVCGIALFFVSIYSLQKSDIDKDTRRLSAMMNTLCGAFLGLLFPYGTKPAGKKWISGIVSAILCLAVIIIPAIERIPLHSLAVVMIVGAWESVEWKKIKQAFSSVSSVIFFVLSFVSSLYFGYVYGILISAALYIFYTIAFRKSIKSKTETA